MIDISVIDKVKELNRLENKNIERKFLKLMEEVGELSSEVGKGLDGYTYKKFNKNELLSEMSDVLIMTISILDDLSNAHGIDDDTFKECVHDKITKWENSIPKYGPRKDHVYLAKVEQDKKILVSMLNDEDSEYDNMVELMISALDTIDNKLREETISVLNSDQVEFIHKIWVALDEAYSNGTRISDAIHGIINNGTKLVIDTLENHVGSDFETHILVCMKVLWYRIDEIVNIINEKGEC